MFSHSENYVLKMLYFSLYLLMLSLHFPLSLSYRGFDRISDPKIGPQGMPANQTTSCAEFSKYARFNPHAIERSKWFVFYYWATPKPAMLYEFWIPSKKDMFFLHHALDGHVPANFNWSATLVIMRDVMTNVTTLLLEKGDRGQYGAYSIYTDLRKGQMTDVFNIRIKQTGDNKYLGIMECKRNTAFIMSRLSDVPPQNKIQDEAARLGYRGRKGKSYLYQGHEWMPVPEQDENEYWRFSKHKPNFITSKQT